VEQREFFQVNSNFFDGECADIFSFSGIILRVIRKPVDLIPKSIANFFSWSFSFFESDRPEEGPFLLGATLEIQREQQIELMEQQMMMTSMEEMMRNNRQFNQRIPDVPPARNPVTTARTPSSRTLPQIPTPQPFVLPPSASSSPGPSPSTTINESPRKQADEESIKTLVEMGFERDQVIEALRRSNNDVTTATSILLE
jgi:hypothetical protein